MSRSTGRSSVAAAAYRSGTELVDMRTGLVHDYTRKGGVVSTEIILPDGGSAERNALWNAAEAAENRKDSRTAREWIIALPAELDEGQRQELATGFGIELATRYGVAVDVAIHLPDREGDNRNHHAHVLTTTRHVSRDARGVLVMGDKASIELSDTKRRAQGMGPGADEVLAIRQLWERMANAALEKAGSAERIDSRSLKAQGLDREATTHLGPVATDMERRHKLSDRGDDNRQVAANNALRAQISAQILDFAAYKSAREEKRPAQDPTARKARPKLADNPLPPHARNPHRMGTLADISARGERLFGPMKEPGQKDQVHELLIDRAEIMKKLGYQVQTEPAPETTDNQVNQVNTPSSRKPWSANPFRDATAQPAKPAPAVGQPARSATETPSEQEEMTPDRAQILNPVEAPKLTGSAAIRARIANFVQSDQPVLSVRERMAAALDKLAGRPAAEPKPAPGREVLDAQTESQRIAGLSIDTLKA
ncbi:MobQ family relaxase, partial [Pseudomonas helleri]|uniref:MobQ family relaxase n=1 Tax=Pseudomonas helleri TaxID=1608996 RepID=UPI003FD66A2B